MQAVGSPKYINYDVQDGCNQHAPTELQYIVSNMITNISPKTAYNLQDSCNVQTHNIV